MAYHEKMQTKVKDIVAYRSAHFDETKMNIDISDLSTHCWRCGEIRRLQRCHIVPSSAEGHDSPDNYFLLCNSCHEEAPNTTNPNRMYEWLLSSRSEIYNTFWGEKISDVYQNLYQKNLKDEIVSRYIKNKNSFEKLLAQKIKECKAHIGQGRLNVSTWVAFWKNLFEEFDYNISTNT